MNVPREERVTINREFESVEQFITEYVTNISRSGAFIRSKDPLPVGTRVNLRFTVILDEIETIEGVGEVVRVSSDPPGMGVAFVELTSYSQKLVEKLITISKKESLHARRQVLRHIHDRKVVSKLFDTLSPRYAQRPGGYTRILKLAPRTPRSRPAR